MHPDIISIGPLTVHSYGFMIVLGFMCGLLLIKIRLKNHSITWSQVMDLGFYLLLAGIAGSKLVFWMIFPSQFIDDGALLFSDPIGFIKNFGSGFVFFGGLFGGALTLYLYLKKHQLPVASTLDLFTPSVPLAHAFGRIGCFLAGCCYGAQCDLPWAVTFNDEKTLAPRHVPLHPVQLYESFFLFMLAGLLLLIEKKTSRSQGRMLPVYIMAYSIWRFLIEFIRGDQRGQFFNTFLSTSQGVSVVAFCIAAGFWICLSKTRNKN